MPTLDKSRGNRWRARVKIAGKVVETKLFGKGPAKGKEWMAARQWEMDRKQELLNPSVKIFAPELMPLDWAVSYLEDVKRRCVDKTFVEKRDAMTRLLEFAKDATMAKITPAMAQSYLGAQHDARSGNAANKDRKNLMAAWEWGRDFLTDRGFPDRRNPFEAVKRFPENRRDRYIPPEADFWKALQQTRDQDRAMLLAFLHLAARRGELFRLKWADVDFIHCRVRLATRKTKDGSWRYDWLPMTRELAQALKTWKAETPYPNAENVFTQLDDTPSPNHRPGEPFQYRQHFMKRLCKRAGVKPFGFHAIRHLSAIVLYKAHYPVSFVQKVLRHQHPLVTERYLRAFGLSLDELREGLEVFDGRGAAMFGTAKTENPGGISSGVPVYTQGVHSSIN